MGFGFFILQFPLETRKQESNCFHDFETREIKLCRSLLLEVCFDSILDDFEVVFYFQTPYLSPYISLILFKSPNIARPRPTL